MSPRSKVPHPENPDFVPRPRASPQPDFDDDEDDDEDDQPVRRTVTGVYKAVEDHWGTAKKALILVGTIGAGILAVGGIASAQTDAGMRVVKDRQELQIQDMKDHKEEEARKWAAVEKDKERQEEKNDVFNRKLDLLLDAARVPMYKRPEESKDGGK